MAHSFVSKRHKLPFLQSLMTGDPVCKSPYITGGRGTSVITQRLEVDIVTDANGDARGYVWPGGPLYISVDPTTGVQSFTTAPDLVSIQAQVEAARMTHLSLTIHPVESLTTTTGTLTLHSHNFDQSITTWNESQTVLSQRPHSKTMPLRRGGYGYGVGENFVMEKFDMIVFQSGSPNTSHDGICQVKYSISGATASTTVAKALVKASWEIVTEDQLLGPTVSIRNVKEYFDTMNFLERIPRCFPGDTSELELENYLDEVDAAYN